MSIRFRFHRGTLEDSLKTIVEVKTRGELASKISELPYMKGVHGFKLVFEHIGFDERCGWETYYVIVISDTARHIVGMSDGVPT